MLELVLHLYHARYQRIDASTNPIAPASCCYCCKCHRRVTNIVVFGISIAPPPQQQQQSAGRHTLVVRSYRAAKDKITYRDIR